VLAEGGTFVWSWKARYFLCHYSNRVQHSAYVRSLEEVVDRFLADRGISVGRMLVDRGWIPVVSRARVTLLADAVMEEVIHTTFTVDNVLKGVGYDATMNCFVHRDADLVHVATARILHGYAVSRGEGAGRLAELDDGTISALTGRQQ
jgi:acyl-CoA thioesterase FadM